MIVGHNLRRAIPPVIAIASFAAFAALLGSGVGCHGDASGSACLFYTEGTLVDFEADETVGFDVVTPPGASVGIAFDDAGEDIALIVAFRFAGTTVEATFEPTCDTDAAITSYDFGATDSVTSNFATMYPFLEDGITDTDGVLAMDHTMNALLIIDDADGKRVFLAVGGQLTLRRAGGMLAENRVTGNLIFVELTGADVNAQVHPDGATVHIDDIDFSFDTTVAPS